jgi:ribosomal protein S18 acetylase RimI-like enzyme
MHLDDWRSASSLEMARCYAAECARWRTTLRWDTTRTWESVEAARGSGALPGFVVRDDTGSILAWSFHLLHRGELQLGTLIAYSQRATESLVKAIAQSPEARSASRWMAFGWFDAPGLANLLRIHSVRTERYRYLYKELPGAIRHVEARRQPLPLVGREQAAIRAWRPEDEPRLAPLLSSAYDGADHARPFAANGTMEEWVEYGTNLIHGSACGTFDPEISCVLTRGQELNGAAIMTRLLSKTAHLAQLAVHSDTQGCGLGEQLLVAALDAAGRAGIECVTLLVRESNANAARLYSRLGFAERARFLSASSAVSARLSAVS